MRTFTACFLLLVAFSGQVWAQSIPVGDPFETYFRLMPVDSEEQQQIPTYTVRPVNTVGYSLTGMPQNHPWHHQAYFTERAPQLFGFYSPTLISTYNSDIPFGQNDGAMWQGRGENHAFSFGGVFEFGPLHISLRPQIGYSRNRDFELSPVSPYYSEYSFPFPNFQAPDVTQRFGENPLTWFHPGQSTIQLQQWGFAAGVSSANIWMGPAMHNPLILSNNAPGFYHGFVGTTRPVVTPIGSFETLLYWGGLRESDYFDNRSGNNLRYVTGLLVSYSPSFAKGLTLGGTRTHYEFYPEDGLTWGHITRTVDLHFTGRTDLKPTTQMLSLFGRWAFPEYGLEAWFEWGLNDGRPQARMLPVMLEHSRAYNLGLLKRFDLPGNRWLSLNFETTHLEHDRTLHSASAASGIWYEHNRRRQGWTHQGQLLGAGIGVGSNNQLLRADLYDRWGLAGISVNRIELHNDKLRRNLSAIRNVQVEPGPFTMTELNSTEFRFGAHGLIFLPWRLELQGDIYQSRFINRHHVYGNHTWNTNVALTLRYQIKGGLR